jgi:hypothetical protein
MAYIEAVLASVLWLKHISIYCPIAILAGNAGNTQYPYLQGSKTIHSEYTLPPLVPW